MAKRRVACVQFDCEHGQVTKNAATVRRLLAASLPPSEECDEAAVDLVILPEMALSGYCFRDAADIEPFLEEPDKGEGRSPSLALARELANQYRAYVSIGFPCRASTFLAPQLGCAAMTASPFDARLPVAERATNDERRSDGFNASLLVAPDGHLVHIFRKHFSFETDKGWSTEGPGFECVHLPLLGKVCVAICMDVNPYDFRAPFDTFELAHFCERQGVDMLVMNMAWLQSSSSSSEQQDASQQQKQQRGGNDIIQKAAMEHCNYLALRLSPFLPSTQDSFNDEDPAKEKKPMHFIACNRIGLEHSSRFAGFSCALHFDRRSMPSLQGCLDDKEGVLLVAL